ncbi:MAG: ATPase, partial [Gammaproteobacteria bacterium]
PEFIELLSALPSEACELPRAGSLAAELAVVLWAELEINPLLLPGENVLDPAALFGVGEKKTRISVINLAGLGSVGNQLHFVNSLSAHLYVWLKKNPKEMRGLCVFDEAKEFIPSGRSTATKETLRRFAAQGRKYGVGMVFATQLPRNVDHEIVGNCKNHFYGRATSPAALDTIKGLIQERGGNAMGVGTLERGIFYAATEGVSAPVKMKTPLCLSYHPAMPLTEDEVIQRAKKQ